MEFQRLQKTYLDHLLRVGIALKQSQQLIEGLSLQQLRLICQSLAKLDPDHQ